MQMSKKKILAIVIPCVVVVVCLIVLLVCLLTLNNVYAKMNRIVSKHNGELDITVKTKTGETELVSTIVVTRSGETDIIEYSVQQLAEFDPNNIADNAIQTVNGSVIANNGVVVKQSGQKVEGVDFLRYSSVELLFKKGYFQNATDEQGVFSAEVVNTGAFTGNSNLKCTDMKVTFDYATDNAKTITVSYVSESGAQVSVIYVLK